MTLPDAQKNPKKYAELFVAIEKHIDVNEIQINGVHLWPLIRAILRKPQKAVKAIDVVNDETKENTSKTKTDFFGGNIFKIIHGIFPFFKNEKPIKNKKNKSTLETKEQLEYLERAEINKIEKLGQVDYLIFSRPNKYYQTLKGKRYAPILDPVYEDLSKIGKASVLCETASLEFSCLNEPVTFDIEPTKKVRKYTERKRFEEIKNKIEKINDYINSIEPELSFDSKKVIFRYNSHAHRKELFKRILEKTKPKIVFFSSFTSWIPLIWACKELSIPSVDIQHGGQGSHHGFNTHYSSVPDKGYHMLPDFFWCWGEHNKKIINRWFPGNGNRHIPIVGGNRWKAKWIKKDVLDLLESEQREFLDKLKYKGKIILITLSHGVDDLIPPQLNNAMKNSSESCYWLIRLHPINRSPELKNRIETMFNRISFTNYEIEHSTDIPLHLLLQYVDYHLSPFSTAVRESVDFNIPTAVVHSIGAMDFSDDIKEGRFSYAETTDRILAFVNNEVVTDNNGEVNLETDDKFVTDLLAEVNEWQLEQINTN